MQQEQVNTWHETSNCPLLGATFIQDKEVHDHCMQVNALHSSEKKHFNKKLDSKMHGLQSAVIPPTGRADLCLFKTFFPKMDQMSFIMHVNI